MNKIVNKYNFQKEGLFFTRLENIKPKHLLPEREKQKLEMCIKYWKNGFNKGHFSKARTGKNVRILEEQIQDVDKQATSLLVK